MKNDHKKNLLDAIIDINRDAAMRSIESALSEGLSPETIVFNILIPAMEDLAEIVRVGPDATLAQLYLASQISSEISDQLIPKFELKTEIKGKIVIGTAYEDFHGLGKKIVIGCIKSQRLEVIDLGLSVSAERFVETAVENEADVIAVSSMMLHTARGPNGPIKVRNLIDKENLKNRVRLIVGGAPYRFHTDLFKEVGADAWSDNGISAVKVIIDLIKEVRPS
ncbi:MAG: cobalamin-dependent protein [Pseudomonadota bacterium]